MKARLPTCYLLIVKIIEPFERDSLCSLMRPYLARVMVLGRLGIMTWTLGGSAGAIGFVASDAFEDAFCKVRRGATHAKRDGRRRHAEFCKER